MSELQEIEIAKTSHITSENLLGFRFFLCSGNPKDWRAISRFVSMAIYGAFNFWLYVRANKKKATCQMGDCVNTRAPCFATRS